MNGRAGPKVLVARVEYEECRHEWRRGTPGGVRHVYVGAGLVGCRESGGLNEEPPTAAGGLFPSRIA